MSKRHKFLWRMTNKLVTVEKAREILKDKAKNLSDKQIEAMIDLLIQLAEGVVYRTVNGKYDK